MSFAVNSSPVFPAEAASHKFKSIKVSLGAAEHVVEIERTLQHLASNAQEEKGVFGSRY